MEDYKQNYSGFNKPVIQELDRKLREHISTLKQHIYYSESTPQNKISYTSESDIKPNNTNYSNLKASICKESERDPDQYYAQLYRNQIGGK